MNNASTQAILFEDDSPFVGWLEFQSPTGKIRAEYIGGSRWALYEQVYSGAFMRAHTVKARKTATCEQVWDGIASDH